MLVSGDATRRIVDHKSIDRTVCALDVFWTPKFEYVPPILITTIEMWVEPTTLSTDAVHSLLTLTNLGPTCTA